VCGSSHVGVGSVAARVVIMRTMVSVEMVTVIRSVRPGLNGDPLAFGGARAGWSRAGLPAVQAGCLGIGP